LESHLHHSLNILVKRIQVKHSRSKGNRKKSFKVIQGKRYRQLKSDILKTIKLTGLIKCLRILFKPLNKHESNIRSLLINLPPTSIHSFYSDCPDGNNNMSFVYQYGRLEANYCGVSKCPMKRIWQHIVHTRHAAFGCTKSITHYQVVAHLDCKFFYAFIPLAYVPNRSREHYEDFIVKKFKFSLNFANLNTHTSIMDKDTPSRLGFYNRFRISNPTTKILPNLLTYATCDLYCYACAQTSDFNPKLNDLLRTSATSKDITIHVTAGSQDATDWCMIDEFFGHSIITTPTGLQCTLSEIKLAIHKKCITSFTVTKLICPAFYQDTKITYSKLFHSLSNTMTDTARTAKLYSYLDAAEYIYNTFERKRAMSLLFKSFKQFKIPRPPLSLSIRTAYPMIVNRRQLVRSGRYLVAASTLPKSAQNLILSRTNLVNKNPNTFADLCCNNLRWSTKWNVNEPWKCCNQCVSMQHLPHRNTYGTNCLAFRADEYDGPFSDIVKCSLKVIPYPDRQSVFHFIVTGLLSFQQRLQRFTEVNISVPKIKELASGCIRFTPPKREYIDTKRVKEMTSHFDGCVMYGLDKNTKMLFVSCPLFHWHLLHTTFQFAATGSPTTGLNYIEATMTPAQYIQAKKDSYTWSHIAGFVSGQLKDSHSKLAKADVIQKYTKEKGRPMIRCHREPERLLKSRVCKAGYFMLMNSGLDHLGINNTRLMLYSDRWKHRESLGATAQTLELLDDMSGFYTCLDRAGVLQRAKYVCDKYKLRHRRGRHWITVARRGCSPPKFGKSSYSDDYVSVHVDEIYEVLVWASGFSCFKLGVHFLRQILGLFQGCALSVILALFTAAADEDRWLCSLGADRQLVFGFRWFDDRFLWFIYTMFSTTSRSKATRLRKDSSQIYMDGIECEPEDPPNFLESALTERPDGTLLLMHNNKNWSSICTHGCQSIITQLPRSSFHPDSILDGYRISRIKSVIMHANTDFGMIAAALQQITEWTTCLGDDVDDVIRMLRCLCHNTTRSTRGIWKTVLDITTRCNEATVPSGEHLDDPEGSECSATICD
jgi:hypothetical protein